MAEDPGESAPGPYEKRGAAVTLWILGGTAIVDWPTAAEQLFPKEMHLFPGERQFLQFGKRRIF